MILDHLVVAAATLEAGTDFVASRLGVRPGGGGKHAFMGTHNRVLRLGDVYLEVIASDPDAVKPARPRWFGLDEFRGAPRLIHWVARTDDLETAAARSLEPLGAITATARGELRWRITIPDDGSLPGGGVIPTLIQWDGAHPLTNLAESGCRLISLKGRHANPERVTRALESLGLALPVDYGDKPGLQAMISSPRGPVVI
jgi:Glyoxalase-like domain